jgi:hypothetical protein
MIQRLIKRLCRNGGVYFINFVSGADPLKGNAVLRGVKIGCDKRDVSFADWG